MYLVVVFCVKQLKSRSRHMLACQIHILIDNLHCLKHTFNSNVDAYQGTQRFILSSVLELLPNFKCTYFGSMNPPTVTDRIHQYLQSEYLSHTISFVKLSFVEKMTRWICYVLGVLLTTMCKGLLTVNYLKCSNE